MAKRLGILTGGGDCPGLNAAIRAVVRTSEANGIECVGFRNGWEGVIEGVSEPLTLQTTRGLLHRGGTVLGTSRIDPYRENAVDTIVDTVETLGLDGLVVIGGEGTLSATQRLHEDRALPVVGIPKTIDNDVNGTDYTIGFLTAVDTATEAIDKLHTTAESHNRVMVIEVMGRNAGWIATFAGMAGGADAILIPERPFDIDNVVSHLQHRAETGRPFSIVVVAEGAMPIEGTVSVPQAPTDEFGRPKLGGIGHVVAAEIESRGGFSVRVTTLGHTQRGGTPSPIDRVLATRMGVKAVGLARGGDWGMMTGLHGAVVGSTPLKDATRELKRVPDGLYNVAEVFFG